MTEIRRGHLAGLLAPAPPVHRYESRVSGVRHYWVPVWDIPPGQVWPQRTLQYPHPLIVISNDYARMYGVTTGLSGVELTGRGWAVGTALRPSAGLQLLGRPMTELTDRNIPLTEVTTVDATGLTTGIRAAMAADPGLEASHRRAIALLEEAYANALRTDPESELIDAICAWVEAEPEVLRVGQICTRFGLGERQLQRLTERRIGLTPKWLIQRRRLQEAAYALRDGSQSLVGLADRLGYADQAHFTRDFTAVVGVPPHHYRQTVRGIASDTGGSDGR